MLGAIETGGTKIVAAVGDNNFNIIEKIVISTTTPSETLNKVIDFFKNFPNLKSIGLGSFGPIDLNKNSKTYGYITSTPKLFWKNFNILGYIKSNLNIPIGFTTDVNISALGEYTLGIAKNKNSCLYLTIGTGIGGGFISNNEIFTGYSHLEMGHIPVNVLKSDEKNCICTFHENCLEGLSSGPSIEKRLNEKAININSNNEVFNKAAYYIAQGLVTYTLTLRPEIIILGGGLMNKEGLLSKIKNEFLILLGNYVEIPPIDEYLVYPSLNDNQGIIGGFVLANKQL